jgi:hypothetical protein
VLLTYLLTGILDDPELEWDATTMLSRSSVIQGVGMLAVTWAYATRGKSGFWLHAAVRRGYLAVRW